MALINRFSSRLELKPRVANSSATINLGKQNAFCMFALRATAKYL
jgi:hypothetical protein